MPHLLASSVRLITFLTFELGKLAGPFEGTLQECKVGFDFLNLDFSLFRACLMLASRCLNSPKSENSLPIWSSFGETSSSTSWICDTVEAVETLKAFFLSSCLFANELRLVLRLKIVLCCTSLMRGTYSTNPVVRSLITNASSCLSSRNFSV